MIENKLSTDYKVFVDTSFLLDGNGQRYLLDMLLPQLNKTTSEKMIVAQLVVEELKELSRRETAVNAKEAMALIQYFAKQGRIDLRGESNEVIGNDVSTHDLFLRVLYRFQFNHSLAFLTNSIELARLIYVNNRSPAFRGAKEALCFRAKDRFTVEAWIVNDASDKASLKRLSEQRVPAIDSLVTDYKLLIDTSSLMSERANGFIVNELIQTLRLHNKKMLLSRRTYDELTINQKKVDSEIRDKATGALAILRKCEEEGVIDAREEENEIAGGKCFVDPLLVTLALQHQKHDKLCFVTQDTGLASLVVDNAIQRSSPEGQTIVVYIDKFTGHLKLWMPRLLAKNRRKPTASSVSNQLTSPFGEAAQVVATNAARLRIARVPTVGESVISKKIGSLVLVDKLSEGGEGSIYRTNREDVVCKIYFQDRLTIGRFEKLKLMVSKAVSIEGVCWPIDLAFNVSGEFVGYLMKRARGKTLGLSIFKPPLLKQHFPDWDRKQLVQLSITVLDMIRQMHELNIIVGDINPFNFLVQDPNEVYLVDTDSFQIEGYPCSVGTETFTPPELQGKNYGEFLRTKDHELFAVGTLLFMILFPGKPPYSAQGGGDLVENIRNKNFPYVREEGELDKKPFGPYRFIWSHLHFSLKSDFRSTFAEGVRVGVNE